MEKNPVSWFEIPVVDMERAMAFYTAVFGYTLDRHTLGSLDMAWLPMTKDAPGAAGSLVSHKEHYMPSTSGVLIYLTAPSGDVSVELSRVSDAGGRVLQEKKDVGGGFGYMGLFEDTEGNRIAIHNRA